MEKTSPPSRPVYELRIVSTWPLQGDERAARQGLRVGIENLRDLPAHAAQVAVLHVGIDIDHAADVVVVHDLHLMSAPDAGEIAQDLWIRRLRRRQACCVVARLMGMFSRSCIVSILYCGVCATML